MESENDFLSVPDSEHFRQLQRSAELLNQVDLAISSKLPIQRLHVVTLKTLFYWQHVFQLWLENSPSEMAEVNGLTTRVVNRLSDELPVLFYAICKRLEVRADIEMSDADLSEAAVVKETPQFCQVWHALEGAAKCNAVTDSAGCNAVGNEIPEVEPDETPANGTPASLNACMAVETPLKTRTLKPTITPDDASAMMLVQLRKEPELWELSCREWEHRLSCSKHAISGKSRDGKFLNTTYGAIVAKRESTKDERRIQ